MMILIEGLLMFKAVLILSRFWDSWRKFKRVWEITLIVLVVRLKCGGAQHQDGVVVTVTSVSRRYIINVNHVIGCRYSYK